MLYVVAFFVVAGNFHYDRKKKFQSSVWRVCQFLVLAGNWQFFCCGGKFSLQPEKKVPVHYRKKKIQSSVWRVRDEFVLVLVKIDLIHFEHSICISST